MSKTLIYTMKPKLCSSKTKKAKSEKKKYWNSANFNKIKKNIQNKRNFKLIFLLVPKIWNNLDLLYVV